MARESKQKRAESKPTEAPKVTAPMKLSGIVRTEKGFAVAVAVINPDGTIAELKVGPSQAFKQFVALEYRRVCVRAALEV